MSLGRCLLLLPLLSPAAAVAQPAPPTELVTEIRVHGNFSVPDAEILELAGVAAGDALAPGALEAIADRLRATDRFAQVDVRKRYTSLSRSDQVALILLVVESPAASEPNRLLRTLYTIPRQTMFMPVLSYDEGLGFTYGARFRLVDVLGEGGSLAVPLTLGGRKQAALELERRFDRGPLDALRGGVSATRYEHQHFRVDDRRTSIWAAGDRRLGELVRVSGEARLADVRLGLLDDRLATYRAAVELDTRTDAGFPRDALFVTAGWSWLDPASPGPVVTRPELDARGFVGLIGQSVLALRARWVGASSTVPVYEQPLLGGEGSVRGHRVGERAGDRLALASAELRLPIGSPLTFANAGVRLFFDTGAVYDVGQSIRKARFSRGAGVGLFLSAAIFSLQLDVGHDTRGSARVHFGSTVSF